MLMEWHNFPKKILYSCLLGKKVLFKNFYGRNLKTDFCSTRSGDLYAWMCTVDGNAWKYQISRRLQLTIVKPSHFSSNDISGFTLFSVYCHNFAKFLNIVIFFLSMHTNATVTVQHVPTFFFSLVLLLMSRRILQFCIPSLHIYSLKNK